MEKRTVGNNPFDIPQDKINEFCRKWQIRELSLFGSALRDDFNPKSDIDLLVTFDSSASWDLWDLIDMRSELETIFGREVDLVEEHTVRNPFRRRAIFQSRQVLYAAR